MKGISRYNSLEQWIQSKPDLLPLRLSIEQKPAFQIDESPLQIQIGDPLLEDTIDPFKSRTPENLDYREYLPVAMTQKSRYPAAGNLPLEEFDQPPDQGVLVKGC